MVGVDVVLGVCVVNTSMRDARCYFMRDEYVVNASTLVRAPPGDVRLGRV